MEVSSQLHAPAALFSGENLSFALTSKLCVPHGWYGHVGEQKMSLRWTPRCDIQKTVEKQKTVNTTVFCINLLYITLQHVSDF